MQKKYFILLLIALSQITTAFPASAGHKSSPEGWALNLTPLFLQGITFQGVPYHDSGRESTGLNFSNQFLQNEPRGRKIHIRASKDAWTLFADYQYIDPNPVTGMQPHDEIMDLKAQIAELGASYRFTTWHDTYFEVLAGTRYKNKDTYSTSAAPRNRLVADDAWWQKGYVGLRSFTRLTEDWTFIGRGDIGAGKGGQNPAWNAVVMLDYSPGDRASFYLGYKLLDFDYADAGTGEEPSSYDALRQGPFIGFSLHW